VHVSYDKQTPNVEADLKPDDDPAEIVTTYGPEKRLQSERGDPENRFRQRSGENRSDLRHAIRNAYPIELQAATAMWDGDKLTIYEESQSIFNMRGVIAQMFGLPKENVRVITKFVGSGFGSKLWP